MKGLSLDECSAYLAIVQRLKRSCKFYDTHVHPYEVLFDRFSYGDEAADLDLLSLPGKFYTAPSVAPLVFPENMDFQDIPESRRLQGIWIMLFRKIYGNVGERVFADHMNLCGMDKVLMLPVPLESCNAADFDSRMRWVKQLYSNEDKFWIAGGIPAALRGEEIKPYAAALKDHYGIKAMKCHQVVSGIDLGSGDRKEWLEELFAACNELQLPLILHGGKNNLYYGKSRSNFGSLEHLKDVDLSLCGVPLVLAHAGCHRCSTQEIVQEVLPLLIRMLKRHSNLYVDISGLGFESLKLVLQSVDGDRILFGSDALYAAQWEAVMMIMHALKELGRKLEESFVEIASINPEKTIFRDGGSHVEVSDNQMESVFGAGAGEVAAGSVQEGSGFIGATESDSGAGVLGFGGPETGDQSR